MEVITGASAFYATLRLRLIIMYMYPRRAVVLAVSAMQSSCVDCRCVDIAKITEKIGFTVFKMLIRCTTSEVSDCSQFNEYQLQCFCIIGL